MPDATTVAWIAAGAAVISATVGVVTVFINSANANKAAASSTKASDSAERSNQISMGQAENGLRAAITSCRERFEDVSFHMEQFVQGRLPEVLTDDEKRHVRAIDARRASSLEAVANAYEIACSQYIDGKVDQERFKKTFFVEIRQLVENPETSFQRLFHPEGISRFKAIWRVYHEWYDLENAPPAAKRTT